MFIPYTVMYSLKIVKWTSLSKKFSQFFKILAKSPSTDTSRKTVENSIDPFVMDGCHSQGPILKSLYESRVIPDLKIPHITTLDS